ncbi:MAG: hypothetical protein JW793_02685 [Acidobacteria bacterium]|nr:hypothetical protein [Acidobacteriota bacterium]
MITRRLIDEKGDDLLEVTDKASTMIKNFLKDREVLPAIRLMLSGG